MEAQQATFGTFNLAAEKVAENLDEDSPGVTEIQDKMEEFNDRWNKITTEVSSRISLVRMVWRSSNITKITPLTGSSSGFLLF